MSPVSRYYTYSMYIQAEEGHRGCRRQRQCHDASDGLTSIYCDCVLVLAHYRLCAYSRSDLLGLRGRSMVTGDSCNWNGNCRKSRQLHAIGNSNLSLTRLSETGSSTSRLGALCLGAAIQFWLTYPETCGKTIEEIEVLFSHDGPHAWKTKKGDSRLHEEMAAVSNAQAKDVARASIEKVVKADKGVHSETTPPATV